MSIVSPLVQEELDLKTLAQYSMQAVQYIAIVEYFGLKTARNVMKPWVKREKSRRRNSPHKRT